MPIVTLKFKLPEEDIEYQECIDGGKYKLVIEELSNFLRQKYKYEDASTITISEVREKIAELVNQYNLELF